jgi:hypothetical protein
VCSISLAEFDETMYPAVPVPSLNRPTALILDDPPGDGRVWRFRSLGLSKIISGTLIAAIGFFATLEILDAYSPLLGKTVRYSLSVEGKPQVCANRKSTILFEGKICRVNGATVSVRWDSLENPSNVEPACGAVEIIKWSRREDEHEGNAMFVGACGRPPAYFENMPRAFDYRELMKLRPARSAKE